MGRFYCYIFFSFFVEQGKFSVVDQVKLSFQFSFIVNYVQDFHKYFMEELLFSDFLLFFNFSESLLINVGKSVCAQL
jgi:hypothetical protein